MGLTSWLTPGWVETHSLTKGSGWAAQVCTGLCGENCLLIEPCRDSHYLGFWIPNMGRAFYSCLCVFKCALGSGGSILIRMCVACRRMFIEVLFIEPKIGTIWCPSTAKWINKIWEKHGWDCYPSVGRGEAETQMILENITQRKRSQMEESLCMGLWKISRIETEVDQCLPGKCGVMGVTANGNRVLPPFLPPPAPPLSVCLVHKYMSKCVCGYLGTHISTCMWKP